MKLDPHQEENTKQQSAIVKKDEKAEFESKLKLLNQLRPHPGQKVYEVDIQTRVVKEAEIEYATTVEFPTSRTSRKVASGKKGRIITKEGTFYVSALNKENALRKFDRAVEDFKIYQVALLKKQLNTTKA